MELLYRLQSIRTPFGDGFFSIITHLGEETLFIVFGLLVFWCLDKWEGYYLLTTGLTGTVINQGLKLWFRVPRPWVRDPEFPIVEAARAEATGYSFPSGHTQSSVGIFGALARWNKPRWLRILCVCLCLGVSFVLALVLVFGFYPLIRKAMTSPKTMRLLLAVMVAGAAGLLLFVTRYPFPADVDVTNLEHGIENAWKMLGCTVGVWLTYECDLRWTRFDTKAPLLGQILKLAFGFAILLGIKAGLKGPLHGLFVNDGLADGLRYLLMVVFAGCIWPMTFPLWAKTGRKN